MQLENVQMGQIIIQVGFIRMIRKRNLFLLTAARQNKQIGVTIKTIESFVKVFGQNIDQIIVNRCFKVITKELQKF